MLSEKNWHLLRFQKLMQNSWKTVSLILTKSIEKVLPRKPDDGWEKIYNPLTHLENADLDCKFRYEPHLL